MISPWFSISNRKLSRILVGLLIFVFTSLAQACSPTPSIIIATPSNPNDGEAWMMYRDALSAQGTLETAYGQMTATTWYQLATHTAEAENRLAATAAVQATEQAAAQAACNV